MGLARLLNRASSPNVQPSSMSPPPYGPTQFMPGPEQRWPPSSVLPPPTEAEALSVPAFWRGCFYVCDTIGTLPARAYRGTDQLDPQPSVVDQPDPMQSAVSFWSGVAQSLTLYGNSICIITSRDRNGWPLTLKPIHPTLAAVRFTGNPMAPDIDAWYVAGHMYDPSDIWHVKSQRGRAGWPLGRGVLDEAGDAIGLALAIQSYGAAYFNAGGMPSGILKIHRPEITQQQADDAKASWISKYSGAPTPAVLNELTDFTPIAFRPVDSQMIEARGQSLIDMALLWGLPPTKLGATTGGGTYRNAEMEEIQSRNDAVTPWTALLEDAASRELLPRGQRLMWDLGANLRTDTLSRYQAYQAALGGPGPTSQWALIDEIRARENLDPMATAAANIAADSPGAEVGEAGLILPGGGPDPEPDPDPAPAAVAAPTPMPLPAGQMPQMEGAPRG